MFSVNLTKLTKKVPIYQSIERRNEMRDWLSANVGTYRTTKTGNILSNQGNGWQLRVETTTTPLTWFVDFDDELHAVMFRMRFSS
jgi:hypothetical protein